MHGRLRLDKLANSIERFLEQHSAKTKDETDASAVESNESLQSLTSGSKNSPTDANLYFQPPRNTPELPTIHDVREEMEAAVPLSEILASRDSHGKLFSLPSSGISFQPLTRHLSLPPIATNAPSLPRNLSSSSHKDRLLGSLPKISLEKRIQLEPAQEPSMRERRPLINRQGTSDLDRFDNEDNDQEDSVDYVTMNVGGLGESHRAIPIIPFEELMLIETLGMGRVSTIYRAVWQRKISNHFSSPVGIQMLALKVAMVNPDTFDTSHVDELRREADIAARLHHPNICDLVGVAADSE